MRPHLLLAADIPCAFACDPTNCCCCCDAFMHSADDAAQLSPSEERTPKRQDVVNTIGAKTITLHNFISFELISPIL